MPKKPPTDTEEEYKREESAARVGLLKAQTIGAIIAANAAKRNAELTTEMWTAVCNHLEGLKGTPTMTDEEKLRRLMIADEAFVVAVSECVERGLIKELYKITDMHERCRRMMTYYSKTAKTSTSEIRVVMVDADDREVAVKRLYGLTEQS